MLELRKRIQKVRDKAKDTREKARARYRDLRKNFTPKMLKRAHSLLENLTARVEETQNKLLVDYLCSEDVEIRELSDIWSMDPQAWSKAQEIWGMSGRPYEGPDSTEDLATVPPFHTRASVFGGLLFGEEKTKDRPGYMGTCQEVRKRAEEQARKLAGEHREATEQERQRRIEALSQEFSVKFLRERGLPEDMAEVLTSFWRVSLLSWEAIQKRELDPKDISLYLARTRPVKKAKMCGCPSGTRCFCLSAGSQDVPPDLQDVPLEELHSPEAVAEIREAIRAAKESGKTLTLEDVGLGRKEEGPASANPDEPSPQAREDEDEKH